MDNITERIVSAVCCFGTGFLTLVVGITHFLMPRDQIHVAKGITQNFFTSLAKTSRAFNVHYWSYAITSLLAIGVVLAIFRLTPQPSLLLQLATVWAIIGFALNALSFLRIKRYARHIANIFDKQKQEAKDTILTIGLSHLEPESLITFGLVGLWFWVLNWYHFSLGILPHGLCLLGMVSGMLYIVVFLSSLIKIAILLDIAVAGAIIIGPSWCIWLGVQLLRIY